MSRGENKSRPERSAGGIKEIRLPYRPHVKQNIFHSATAEVALFGGSAGPGKTTALLMDALIFVIENPGSTACLMRRTYPELESSLIKKSLEMFPREFCRYNSAKHRWTIAASPSANSYVEFVHCERTDDVFKHRSSEWQYLGIDESTSFTQEMFDQLMTRVRSSKPGVKCKVRLCTNPGMLGHSWHRKYFDIGGRPPYEIWRPEKGIGDKYDPPTRCYIPATIFDNPSIIENDPTYLARLEALPESQKRMLLYGDWTGFSGQFFAEFDRGTHMVQPFDIPRHWKRFRSVDFGFDKPFSCHWTAIDERGHAYTYREAYKRGLRDREQAQLIKDMSMYQGTSDPEVIEYSVADPSQVVRGKDSGITTQQNFHDVGVAIFPGSNARAPGWMAMRNWLSIDPTTGQPWWKIFNTCPELIREVEEAVYDPNKPEDIDQRGSDHAIDEMRYLWMSRPAPSQALKKDDARARLDPNSSREWELVHKLQDGIAADANGTRSILHGLNE